LIFKKTKTKKKKKKQYPQRHGKTAHATATQQINDRNDRDGSNNTTTARPATTRSPPEQGEAYRFFLLEKFLATLAS